MSFLHNATLYNIPNLDKFLLNIKIDLNGSVSIDNEKNDLLIVLDKSGSMSGTPINLAITGIKNLISKAKWKLNKSYLMTFDTNTQLYRDFNSKEIDRIFASGGTCFTPVLADMRYLLKEFTNNLTVLFFTDGCGSYKQSDLDSLAKDIKNLKYNCVVHTIGFSEEHDAVLLSNLTRIGSTLGTFQFVENYNDIEE